MIIQSSDIIYSRIIALKYASTAMTANYCWRWKERTRGREKELEVRSKEGREDRETNRWEIPFRIISAWPGFVWTRTNRSTGSLVHCFDSPTRNNPCFSNTVSTAPKTLHRFALRDFVSFDRVKFTSRFHDDGFFSSFNLFTSFFFFLKNIMNIKITILWDWLLKWNIKLKFSIIYIFLLRYLVV